MNRHVFLIASCFLICCAEVTYKAGVRRNAETRLNHCLADYGKIPDFRRGCYKEVRDFCVGHKLERTCGEGAP